MNVLMIKHKKNPLKKRFDPHNISRFSRPRFFRGFSLDIRKKSSFIFAMLKQLDAVQMPPIRSAFFVPEPQVKDLARRVR